jgi:ArsR family transcriptional regulator, lead/cadmium/zinc/bismuth-responsive transcriptional repressor
MHLNELATALKIIGEENRLRIMCLLFKEKKLCVSHIADHLTLSIATTSFHLKTLEKHGLLRGSREGKEICYEVVVSSFTSGIKKLICQYIKL